MSDKHCGKCKYFAEPIGKEDLHRCNNDKSIVKTCLFSATGCTKFELRGKHIEGAENEVSN